MSDEPREITKELFDRLKELPSAPQRFDKFIYYSHSDREDELCRKQGIRYKRIEPMPEGLVVLRPKDAHK